MKKKEIFCKFCSNPLEDDGTCKMCPKGNIRRQSITATTDLDCDYNEHGRVCGKRGSLSDSIVGGGPWQCPEHYWKLKGRTIREGQEPQPDYRQRWYAERGLPFEKAKVRQADIIDALKPWTAMLGKEPRLQPRQREPGDDDDTPMD